MDKRHLFTQKIHDKSDINIVQTSMREDVFGTLAQMKHSLLRRSSLK
jgi:hypothetical protein